MPYQELEKASAKSCKSAPAKESVQVRGESGFIIRDSLEIVMQVTHDNLAQCCDELKKHLKAHGPFVISTDVDNINLRAEDPELKTPKLHLIVKDIKLTCGDSVDLTDLGRCAMYRAIYQNPVFEHVKGCQNTQRMIMNCGTSNNSASKVLEDDEEQFQSLFSIMAHQEDDDFEVPAFTGLCDHIPELHDLLDDLVKVLVFGQDLKLVAFFEKDPYTNVYSLRRFVQLTYWNKRAKRLETTLLQDYEDFCRTCTLVDKLMKVKAAYDQYM